jgi:hypothetical protein
MPLGKKELEELSEQFSEFKIDSSRKEFFEDESIVTTYEEIHQ